MSDQCPMCGAPLNEGLPKRFEKWYFIMDSRLSGFEHAFEHRLYAALVKAEAAALMAREASWPDMRTYKVHEVDLTL